MARIIEHIDDLSAECGFFAKNEPETHNGHNYGCNNPENTYGDLQCMASSCPLGCLAEADHFEEIWFETHEDAIELAEGDEYVVVDE